MPDSHPRRTLRELAAVIFARWVAIIGIAAIITAATVVVCLRSDKTYRSSVTLWARMAKPANPLAEEKPDQMNQLEVFLKRQREIIFSEHVLKRTLVRLDGAVGDEKIRAATEAVTGERIARFRRKIKVTTPEGEEVAKSDVFTIRVDQPGTPERARDAAAILTEEYLARERELRTDAEKMAGELIESQLKELKEKTLGQAERRFNTFIAEKVRGDLLELTQLGTGNTEVYHQRIRTASNQELIKLDARISEYQALRRQVQAQIPKKALVGDLKDLTPADLEGVVIVIPEAVFRRNGIIDKLKRKLADLIIARNALREQYTDQFKLLRQNSGEIFHTTVDILRELRAERKAIDQYIVTLNARKGEISRRVAEEDKTIDRLSSLFVEYQALTRELKLARSLYNTRRRDLLEANTARQMAERQILIARMGPATLPDVSRPVKPILWLYTLVAAIASVLLGVSYAFLADTYDHTLKSIDQAERYFGLNVMASIPDLRGGIVRR